MTSHTTFTHGQFHNLHRRILAERDRLIREWNLDVPRRQTPNNLYGFSPDTMEETSIKKLMERQLQKIQYDLTKFKGGSINGSVLYDAFRNDENAQKNKSPADIKIAEKYAEAFLAFIGSTISDLNEEIEKGQLHSTHRAGSRQVFTRLTTGISVAGGILLMSLVLFEKEPHCISNGTITEPVNGLQVGNSINCKGKIDGEHCYLWLVVEIVDHEGRSLFWPKDEITKVDIKENGAWSKQIFDESPPGLQPTELSISLWNVSEEGHKIIQHWIREGSLRKPTPAFPPLSDIAYGKRLFRVDNLVKQRLFETP